MGGIKNAVKNKRQNGKRCIDCGEVIDWSMFPDYVRDSSRCHECDQRHVVEKENDTIRSGGTPYSWHHREGFMP